MKIMNTVIKKIVMGVVLVGFGMSYAEESGYFASFVRNMRGALDFVSPSDFESTMQEPAANGTFWMKKFLKRVAHGIGGVVDATFKPKFVEKVVTESVTEPTVTSFPVETIVPTVSPSLALNDSRVVEEPSFMWNVMTSKPVLVGAIGLGLYSYLRYRSLNAYEDKLKKIKEMHAEINSILSINTTGMLFENEIKNAIEQLKLVYLKKPSPFLLKFMWFSYGEEHCNTHKSKDLKDVVTHLLKNSNKKTNQNNIEILFVNEVEVFLFDMLKKQFDLYKDVFGINIFGIFIQKYNAIVESLQGKNSARKENVVGYLREMAEFKEKIRMIAYFIINKNIDVDALKHNIIVDISPNKDLGLWQKLMIKVGMGSKICGWYFSQSPWLWSKLSQKDREVFLHKEEEKLIIESVDKIFEVIDRYLRFFALKKEILKGLTQENNNLFVAPRPGVGAEKICLIQ